MPPLGWRAWLWVLIPVAGLVAYAGSLSNGFVLDDEVALLTNPDLQALESWGSLVSRRQAVTDLTYALNHSLGGPNPRGYRMVTLAIHVLVAMTLFGIMRRTLTLPRFRTTFGAASPWIALTSALLWLVHPLQTASITHAAHRAEVLMGLFYLLVIYGALRGARSSRPDAWYTASILACALGMGSKAAMVTAPVAVLLFDRTFLSESWWRALTQRRGLYIGLACTWLLLIPSGVAGELFALGTNASASSRGANAVTPAVYLMTQPGVILQYLKQALWPTSLVLDYGWQPVRDAAEAQGPILVVIGLLMWTLWALIRRRPFGFIAVFFFLVLLPTSSFIPHKEPILEHRMYLPLAAMVIALVIGVYVILRDLTSSRSRTTVRTTIATALTVAATTILTYGTISRNRDYRDAKTIWSDVLSKRPDHPRAHLGVGIAAYDREDYAVAQAYFDRATQLDPDYGDAWYHYGNVLIQTGRYDEAVTAYRHAIELNSTQSDRYYNLGVALKAANRPEEALSAYALAIWYAPEDPRPYLNTGNIHLEEEDYNQAIRFYDAALERDPEYLLALNNKAAAYMAQGRYADAVVLYDAILAIDPEREVACVNRDLALSVLAGEDPFADADTDAS